jgi:hypothetical protein
MREAQGLSRIDLANNHDRAAIDPVAIMMLEHGRLSTRELGTVFLSRVAIALGTSLSTLEALRDDYAVEAASTKIAGQRVSIAHAVSGWLRSAYSAILPQSPEMAVALGDGGASTIHADTGVHSQGNRTIDRPVPLAVTTLVDHLGRSFQAVPTLTPESHPLPGVCGVEVALTDDTNTPVSGRRIRLIVLGNPILRDVEPTATTDERGIAQFARISLTGILAGYELAESDANASPFTLVPDA